MHEDDTTMSHPHSPQPEEVDQLLLNAQLRDELEPYTDEALMQVNVQALPTPKENEYLASMLAWERAPVLPLARWFEPALSIPHPDEFSEDRDGQRQLASILWETIQQLFEKRVVLDFTDHLSDRELYTLVFRDILPSQERKIDSPDSYLHWDCADVSGDPEVWLRYYASDEEREQWADEFGVPVSEHEMAPFRRQLPRRPL